MSIRIAVFTIALLHFVFLSLLHEPGYNSPDAHGYFIQGKLLAETGCSRLEDESPVQMVGMHWLETETGELYSRYPTGLPILIAIVYKMAGPQAATWINLALCSLSLPLVYYLTRSITTPLMGIVAMLFLAINPVFNQYALNADSHISTLFFLVAGLAAMTRWNTGDNLRWALAAGFLLGYIPVIRYPEALFGIGIAAFLVITVLRDDDRIQGAIVAALGAVLPMIYLLFRNTLVFGAPLRTAYALTNEQSAFSRDYFLGGYSGYLEGLMSTGLGPAFAAGILSIVGLLVWKNMRKWGILIIFTTVPITLLYVSYYFGSGNEMTMRFVLPTFPLYIIATCFLISELSRLWKLNAAWIASVLMLLTAATAIPGSIIKLARQSVEIRESLNTLRVLQQHVPAESVLFIGQQMSQLADYLGNWKLADGQLLLISGSPMHMQRPPAGDGNSSRPSPLQEGRREEIIQRYQDLSPEDKMDLVIEDARAWAGSGDGVYVVTYPSAVSALQNGLHPDYEWEPIAEIDLNAGIRADWRDRYLEFAAKTFHRAGSGPNPRGAPSARPLRVKGPQDLSGHPAELPNRSPPPLTTADRHTLSVYKLVMRQ